MGSAPATLIAQLQRFRRRLAERYAIERMILFGSQARGKARGDSDVDVIVVSPRFRGKNAIDRAALLRMEWDHDVPIDFLCYTPEEFEDLSRRPSIVAVALEEGVAVPRQADLRPHLPWSRHRKLETLMDDYGRMRREDAFRILREARRAPVRVEDP